tara:strand:+ start:45084 stop:45419 length:336 start_codon:yes stop_codon:yes gene_type:complete
MNDLIKTWEKERLDLLELAEKHRETSSYNFYKLTHKALQLKYCIKSLREQLVTQGAVPMLPNIDSKEFKEWRRSGKYVLTTDELYYTKNGAKYDKKVVYRAFTNEIEFGNK